jgi:hypothetical protein
LEAADEEQLHISVLTLGEIRSGIARVQDATKQVRLEALLSEVRSHFSTRTLSIDSQVGERWGHLTARLAAVGQKMPAIDSLLAATALQYDLTLVTRNEADFRSCGVTIVNPFSER